MSELTDVFDQLGQEIIPLIAESVFPDLMDIVVNTPSADALGGTVAGAETVVYSGVPVNYEPVRDRDPDFYGNTRMPRQTYELEFPSHHDSERISIDAKTYLLRVLERGNEPEKLFRIFSIKDAAGVVLKATCELREE